MVKGRLPRESNPLPGDKSGFVASHDTTGAEDYKRTSPLNPLPVTSIGDSNVKDAAVKAELELIKQGIADNKATNDLILARLDGTIDTQVTGSNVEDGLPVKQVNKLEVIVRLNNVEVGAGQSVMGYYDTVAERLDFTEIRYNLTWNDEINWRLISVPRINRSTKIAGSTISIDETSTRSSGIFIDRLDFTRYSFILHNDSEEDVTLDQIEILGVRA